MTFTRLSQIIIIYWACLAVHWQCCQPSRIIRESLQYLSNSLPPPSSLLPNYSKDLPNYSKNLPNYSKNLPNYSKNLPNYSKNLPNYSKDLPKITKNGKSLTFTAIFPIHVPSKWHKNAYLNIYFVKISGGGMPPDPPLRALRLTPLAIPKPPEIQPPLGWQHCIGGSLGSWESGCVCLCMVCWGGGEERDISKQRVSGYESFIRHQIAPLYVLFWRGWTGWFGFRHWTDTGNLVPDHIIIVCNVTWRILCVHMSVYEVGPHTVSTMINVLVVCSEECGTVAGCDSIGLHANCRSCEDCWLVSTVTVSWQVFLFILKWEPCSDWLGVVGFYRGWHSYPSI